MAAPGLFLYGPSRKTWRETVSKFALSETDGGRLLVSPPLSDPLSECNYPGGITPSFYQVPSSGLTLQEHDRAMAEPWPRRRRLRDVVHGRSWGS